MTPLPALALLAALAACAPPGTTPAAWPEGRGTEQPGIHLPPPGPDGGWIIGDDGQPTFVGQPEPNPPALDRAQPQE